MVLYVGSFRLLDMYLMRRPLISNWEYTLFLIYQASVRWTVAHATYYLPQNPSFTHETYTRVHLHTSPIWGLRSSLPHD